MAQNIKKKQTRAAKTILVVDDEKDTCVFLSQLLEKEGYIVNTATSGKEAISIFKKERVDLVITDLKMPEMDGLALLKESKRLGPETKFIIMTAYGEIETYLDAINLGAFDYLSKPMEIDDIRECVKKALYISPLELEVHKHKTLASTLTKQNKHLKRELANIKKDAFDNESEKYKVIFGSIAHDLKGEFLHIARSIKELRELVKPTQEIQEEFDLIERSIGYSRLLLRRLLDYLNIGRPQLKPVKIVDVVKKAEFLVRPRLPHHIQLTIEIGHGIKEAKVLCDPEQLSGVLIELMNNSINAMRENGGRIELTIESNNSDVFISVRDNGSGISKNMRKELFKQQVPSKKGLGLGLFLCNKIIDEFNGKLKVTSSFRKGTTFTIKLPKITKEEE